MTEKQQKRFYFPAWRSCAESLGWIMSRGRLQCDLQTLRSGAMADNRRWPEPARSALLQVVDYAEQLASQDHRAATAEDLRHSCNLVATGGKRSSSGDFTNAEVDKVVTLFKLLQDPEDLEAMMAWSAYQRGEDPGAVKRVKYFIEHAAPDAYVRKVAGDKFGTRMWEWLELWQLKQLAATLANRSKAWRSPLQEESHTVDEPF